MKPMSLCKQLMLAGLLVLQSLHTLADPILEQQAMQPAESNVTITSEQTTPITDESKSTLADEIRNNILESWRTGQIEAAFVLSNHLNARDIDVTVAGHTATLKGKVDDEIKKDLAGEVAINIEGVDEVRNNIIVQQDNRIIHEKRVIQEDTLAGVTAQTSPYDDDSHASWLADFSTTTRVQTRLVLNPHLQRSEINVQTTQGVVAITGRVTSEELRELVEYVVKNTKGVKGVHNLLEISIAASEQARYPQTAQNL
ncbi:BON superfamily periplasmic protein [Oleiphilus messinensis]|uniref:BON superfamily periplasmic protein n=1 Tax=Oleiphilus messinensis TaxID=141451 RepID=A0A1Y0I5F1_9GAMM|nr:BON domain-containing protein [Oleiphilus messinensis]ARU55718.1 BON superfamily periplasmic protein [Oleiphilus messinensis]